MDRSIGTLRDGLAEIGIWPTTRSSGFAATTAACPRSHPRPSADCADNKGTIYEGGLRVPGIIEWPAKIKPRVSGYPASVLDIVPTLLEITGAKHPAPARPLDGVSLVPLFSKDLTERDKPIPFRHTGKAALVDNRYKLLTTKLASGKFELYDLINDPAEKDDLFAQQPQVADRLRAALLQWNESVERSFAGKDYPEGRVDPLHPQPRFWTEVEAYQPYFPEWQHRWEYASRLNPKPKKKNNP